MHGPGSAAEEDATSDTSDGLRVRENGREVKGRRKEGSQQKIGVSLLRECMGDGKRTASTRNSEKLEGPVPASEEERERERS